MRLVKDIKLKPQFNESPMHMIFLSKRIALGEVT